MNRLWIIVLTVAMTALLTAGCSRQVAPALQGGDHTAGNAKFVVGWRQKRRKRKKASKPACIGT
jgi:hypothetical protein